MDITQFAPVLTAIIALMGLVLSAYNTFILKIEKRPVVHVETADYVEGKAGVPNSEELNLFAANNGEYSVTLAGIGYTDVDSSKKVFLDPSDYRFPHYLGPGTCFSIYIRNEHLPRTYGRSGVYFFLKDGRRQFFISTVPYPASANRLSP